MDNAQPTLKDLARRLNLSVGTVQRALHNKGGYRPETQQRVLEEAARIGYKTNAAASSLSRKPISIAVLLPEPVGVDLYFYRQVWHGIDQAREELAAYQINVHRFYARNHSDAFYQILHDLSLSDEFQGVIASSAYDERCSAAMQRFAQRQIPVALINTTRKKTLISGGAMAADILSLAHSRSKGQMLLLGGARENELLQRRALDFSRQLNSHCKDLTLLELYLYHDLGRLEAFLHNSLPTMDDLVGVVAVSARETMCMCRAVSDLGLSGKLTTVGVDAFPEMLPYFNDQSLTASIYHYPSRMSYTLVHSLVSQLTGIAFPCTGQPIPASPVFQSSAEFFCNHEGVL